MLVHQTIEGDEWWTIWSLGRGGGGGGGGGASGRFEKKNPAKPL